MDLKSELLKQPGPVWATKLCDYVCEDKVRFQLLMKLFLDYKMGDYRLNQRSALIILEVERVKPQWVHGQIGIMVNTLHKTLPVAYKRNILRVLQNQKIPEDYWGHAADQCFQYLGSAEEQIAVKVFSMTVLYNLSQNIPEFARELKLLIEDQYPFGSAGFKSRARKILTALTKEGH